MQNLKALDCKNNLHITNGAFVGAAYHPSLSWLDLTGCNRLASGLEVVLALPPQGPTVRSMSCLSLRYLFDNALMSSLRVAVPLELWRGLHAKARLLRRQLGTLGRTLRAQQSTALMAEAASALQDLCINDTNALVVDAGFCTRLSSAVGTFGEAMPRARVDQLKAMCGALRLPISGRRAELDNRIASCLWSGLSAVWLLMHSFEDLVSAASHVAQIGSLARPRRVVPGTPEHYSIADTAVDVPRLVSFLLRVLKVLNPRLDGGARAAAAGGAFPGVSSSPQQDGALSGQEARAVEAVELMRELPWESVVVPSPAPAENLESEDPKPASLVEGGPPALVTAIRKANGGFLVTPAAENARTVVADSLTRGHARMQMAVTRWRRCWELADTNAQAATQLANSAMDDLENAWTWSLMACDQLMGYAHDSVQHRQRSDREARLGRYEGMPTLQGHEAASSKLELLLSAARDDLLQKQSVYGMTFDAAWAVWRRRPDRKRDPAAAQACDIYMLCKAQKATHEMLKWKAGLIPVLTLLGTAPPPHPDAEGGAAQIAHAPAVPGEMHAGGAVSAAGQSQTQAGSELVVDQRSPPAVAAPGDASSPASCRSAASPRAVSEHCSSGACPVVGEESTPGVPRGGVQGGGAAAQAHERHSSSRHSSSSISRRLVFQADDDERQQQSGAPFTASRGGTTHQGPRVVTMQQYLQSIHGGMTGSTAVPHATMVPVRSPASGSAPAAQPGAHPPSSQRKPPNSAHKTVGAASRRAGRMAQIGASAGARLGVLGQGAAGSLTSPDPHKRPRTATADTPASNKGGRTPPSSPARGTKRMRSALEAPVDGLAPAKRAAGSNRPSPANALHGTGTISTAAHQAALSSSAAYRELVSARERCGRLHGRDASRVLGSMLTAAGSSHEAQSAEWRATVEQGGHFAALLVCKHLLLRRALLLSAVELQHSCPDPLRLTHDRLMVEYKLNKEHLRSRKCLPRL